MEYCLLVEEAGNTGYTIYGCHWGRFQARVKGGDYRGLGVRGHVREMLERLGRVSMGMGRTLVDGLIGVGLSYLKVVDTQLEDSQRGVEVVLETTAMVLTGDYLSLLCGDVVVTWFSVIGSCRGGAWLTDVAERSSMEDGI
ncbi:hypothetical protein Tco_1210095 [Tanacetum coccineum]